MARAALYARQSQTRDDRSASIDTQLEDLRALAERQGWAVVGVYVDRDAPAEDLERRARWIDLLEDAKAGAFDVVAAYDTSRLWRNVELKLATFKQLHAVGVAAVATLAGESATDPDGNPEDGFVSTVLAAVAEYDNRMRAAKVRRAKQSAAKQGRANGGGRPYGYKPDGVTVVEAEAEVLRECATRFLAGESLTVLARDLNARGVPTTKGGKWTARTLGHILRAPRLAALRVHKGEAVGDAAWEPIIDRETHERLKASLAPKRKAGRPPATLLAGIAVCGRCSTPQEDDWNPLWAATTVNDGRKARRYRCPADSGHGGCGKVAVTAEPLENEVWERLLARLVGGGLADALEAAASDDADQRQAAETLAACERELDDLADMLGDGTIDRRGYTRARERIETRASAAQRVLRRNGRAHVLAGLPADEDGLRAAWEAGDVDWRRALLRAVVERVIVAPAARRGPFDPERVKVVWRA